MLELPGNVHASIFRQEPKLARVMLNPMERKPHTVNATTLHHEAAVDREARLVRNLLALRMLLSMDQMQTGKWGDRIEELDEELASLGHDMKSTAACAAEGLRRTFLLPRLANRRSRPVRRATRAAPLE
jgi:hypothetical protein